MTAVIVTAAPGAGELARLLGEATWERVRGELRRHASEWAEAVAPGRVTHAFDDPRALADLAREAFEREGGPLLIAAAETPRLTPAHAAAALADLADGADATFGPGMDGGWYLAGLAHPHAALLELLEASVEGVDVMGRTLGAAQAANLEVGLLRMERLLRTPQDAAALRIDPLVPDRVRRALAGEG